MMGMAEAAHPKRRWLRLTPAWVPVVLLVVEGLLWLSNRVGWPAWHKGYAVLATLATVGMALLLTLLWFVAALLFRWRFQFSIRSLLLLTLVVAMPCGWLSREVKKAREQREAVEAIDRMDGEAGYDWECDAFGNRVDSEPPAMWLQGSFGKDLFADVVFAEFAHGDRCTDAAVQYFKGLPQLQGLYLERAAITDFGLKHIGGLAELRCLSLGGTAVTNVGLRHLKGLTRLQVLVLAMTGITDDGLENLARLSRLRVLGLDNTQVTDAGLRHLEGLIRLEILRLHNTQVTDEGVKKLQQALPNCQIHR